MKKKVVGTHDSYDGKDIEELDSEAAFVRKEGFTRINPQSSSEAEFMCDKCKIALTSDIALRNHMKNHRASCNMCSKTFPDKNSLSRH